MIILTNFWQRQYGGYDLETLIQSAQTLFSRDPLLQQYRPCTCIHGEYCPVCKENSLRAKIEAKKQEALKTQKKLDYQNRCKDYMKKFRHTYNWGER